MKPIIKLIILLLFTNACVKDSQVIVNNLKCEYKVNPLGIDIQKPRFFWQINDPHRGAVQTAYQILVSSSEKKLNKGEADIWNSGKVESNQSAHVTYEGPTLQSHKTYFWKVKTWDNKGESPAFSNTASWEMGILSDNEWEANWIGKEIKLEPTIIDYHGKQLYVFYE